MATFANQITHIFSGIQVYNTGLNNDADVTEVIDAAKHGIIANRASIVGVLTAGSSAFDIAIQGSIDNINWADIVTGTADDTPVTGTGEDAFRYYRVDVTTIGSGNTMDVYWVLAE